VRSKVLSTIGLRLAVLKAVRQTQLSVSAKHKKKDRARLHYWKWKDLEIIVSYFVINYLKLKNKQLK
jgi:hypothetical protein